MPDSVDWSNRRIVLPENIREARSVIALVGLLLLPPVLLVAAHGAVAQRGSSLLYLVSEPTAADSARNWPPRTVRRASTVGKKGLPFRADALPLPWRIISVAV